MAFWNLLRLKVLWETSDIYCGGWDGREYDGYDGQCYCPFDSYISWRVWLGQTSWLSFTPNNHILRNSMNLMKWWSKTHVALQQGHSQDTRPWQWSKYKELAFHPKQGISFYAFVYLQQTWTLCRNYIQSSNFAQLGCFWWDISCALLF